MARRITGLSSMATRQLLAELAETYQARSGCEVAIRSLGGVEVARLVRQGEPADLIVLASPGMEELERDGHLRSSSRRPFARSGIAVAVPEHAPRESIADAALVKQAILGAGRIAYSTGPSGNHLKSLLRGWGIAAEIERRLLQAPPGVPVATLLASGEADLGFQQLSELQGVPGIAILGPLPSEIQAETVFVAGLSTISAEDYSARALLDFLTSAETAGAKLRHGMAPP